MSNGIKKPGRVGQRSAFFGILIAVVIEIASFGVFLGMPKGIFKLLGNIMTIFQMNPAFGFCCGMMAILGGRAIGDLMDGGRHMGSTSELADLDKI